MGTFTSTGFAFNLEATSFFGVGFVFVAAITYFSVIISRTIGHALGQDSMLRVP